MPAPPNRATSTPESDPAYRVTYTCRICRKTITFERSQYGSLPTVCPDCQSKAASERVKRWRERHPDRAKEANRRTVEQRKAKKADAAGDETE